MRGMARILLAVLIAVAVGSIQSATASERARWKMHSIYSGATALLGELPERFADGLAETSDGAVRVQVFEPGALVPRFGYLDAVANGAIDLAWGTPAVLGGRSPAFALFTSVPFGLGPDDHRVWLDGEGGTLYDELHARQGLHGVPCGIIGADAAGWFKRPVETVTDLRGLRVRFFGLGARTLERLGASTQLLAPADLYAALSTGAIDAAEFTAPYADLQFGLHQVARHYYYPGWHQPATMFDVVMSLDSWNGLTAKRRRMIETVCRDTVLHAMAEHDRLTPAALAELEGKGVAVGELPAPVVGALRDAWEAVAAEEAARDPDFARVLFSYRAFMRTRGAGG